VALRHSEEYNQKPYPFLHTWWFKGYTHYLALTFARIQFWTKIFINAAVFEPSANLSLWHSTCLVGQITIEEVGGRQIISTEKIEGNQTAEHLSSPGEKSDYTINEGINGCYCH
jgi:hypothetical protein